MAYTAAFPQSGSSALLEIRVISASNIGQASNTREIPLLSEVLWVLSSPPYWISRGWDTRSMA